MMAGPTLYLASASPRRRELVRALHIPFATGVAPVDEKALEAIYRGPAEGLAEYLARAKGTGAAATLPEAAADARFILTADTTVVLAGTVLGKPRDTAEAGAMLRALRGRVHTVVTGVALTAVARDTLDKAADEASCQGLPPRNATVGASAPGIGPHATGAVRSTSVATRVHMRDYTDEEITAYVASGDPLDKAGAYGVQHPDFQPVASVEGCYLGVVGLPLCAVAALLAQSGVQIPRTQDARIRNIPAPCAWWPRCQPPLPTFGLFPA